MCEDPFDPLRKRLTPLAGAGCPWAVAGGWAVDLWVGRTTRHHEDVDIAVFRGDERRLVRTLRGWSWEQAFPAGSGRLVAWDGAADARPRVHELHAKGPGGAGLEFLLEESDSGNWVFRRDSRLVLARARLAAPATGAIGAVVPEVVLLYKAKNPRDRDHRDFEVLLPALNKGRRTWLKRAQEACYPGHAWAQRL